jgi:hypothetical protein
VTELDLVLAWARAFALTLVIELAVAVPLLSRDLPSLPRRLILVTFSQLSTHPLLWFVLPALHLRRDLFLIAAELWAWLGEAAFYAVAIPGLSVPRAAGISLGANAASIGIGLSLRSLGVAV